MTLVKEELTACDLESIAETGIPYYTHTERQFLEQFAPYSFSGKPIDLGDRHILTDIAQVVFDVVVRLDIAISKGANPSELFQEEAKRVNPILPAFSIDEVVVSDNGYLSALYNLKMRGLDVLKRIARPSSATLTREVDSHDFKRERRELCALFGYTAPILVYGSSVAGNNPSDIDIMVLPQNFTAETYQKIHNIHNPNRNPPFTFVIVPEEYLAAFVLCGDGDRFHKNNSLVINGKWEVPDISWEELHDLRLHAFANQYIRLRRALTPEGLKQCAGILDRINSRIKSPRFMYENLVPYLPDGMLQRPKIHKLQSLPTGEQLIARLVTANLQIYNILCAYQK